MTIIAFVGSVFSPYYAWARQRGAAAAEDFCAINVALYGATKRWALTERGYAALQRDRNQLRVGPSAVRWDGQCLEVEIDEITMPVPSRLRGTVRLYPPALSEQEFALDRGARHMWWPAAPRSRVEVDMQNPGLSWQGDGYFDANRGCEPLEQRFVSWDWSRAMLGDGRCAVLYNRTIRDEPAQSLGLCFDGSGEIEPFEPPPNVELAKTRAWRIARATQCDPGYIPGIDRTLEDTPFYARSLVNTQLLGQPVTAMHESLSLERFRQPWVRLLLPFRMPRRAGRRPG